MCLWGVIIRKKEEIFFFFTSLGESRSSIVSAGSLEHATSDRATMQKPARPGSETTPWLFPEKLQRDEAAFSLRLLRYSWLWIRSGEVVVFLWNRKKRSCFSVLRLIGGVSPPVLLRSWVSLLRLRSQSSPAGSMGVFTKRGGGREREKEGERGGRTPPPRAGNEVRQTMCEDEEDSSSQGTSFPRKRANSWFKLVDIYFFALFL